MQLIVLLLFLIVVSVGGTSAFSVATATSPTSGATRKTNPIADTIIRNADDERPLHFLIHKGRSKDMILRSPSIAGLTLIENWSDEATEALRRAVKRVVEANPILRGRVHTRNSQLWIDCEPAPSRGTNLDGENFLRILPTPPEAEKVNFSRIQDPSIRLDIIQEHIIPLFDECELTSTQEKRNLPLFSVTLVRLPNNYAVYAIQMSHACGDGVTFFQIVKQLSLHMSGLHVCHPIDWDCPLKATHELSPPFSTKRDAHVTYGPPMMLGALRNIPSLFRRKTEVFLLAKHKVNSKKRLLRRQLNNTDISANDVITAALCGACQSSDLFLFTENVREKGGPVPTMSGGNFLIEVPVSKQTASQPGKLRQVVHKHGEYAPGKIPALPFVLGRVGRITSMASIAETVLFDGTKVLCTLPLASFIGQIPLDVAVIFRYDKEHWGVLHNFGKFDRKAELVAELLTNQC